MWRHLVLGLCVLYAAAETPEPVPTELAARWQLVAKGIESPLWAGPVPGSVSTLAVCEQRTGRIRLVDERTGEIAPQPLLTIEPLLARGWEQGLLGMAFHPKAADNGFVYVYWTAPGGGPAGQVVVARFSSQGLVADPASRSDVIRIPQPEENHNGGWIAFGPDGFLWLGIGDGGGANDRHGTIGNGQNPRSLLGKLLRLDVDSRQPYAIPTDNPFVDREGFRGEIAAWGLRNPWRCAFDRANGDLWIGDVGQNQREEIDLLPAKTLGLNFGWRPREGFIATPGINDPPSDHRFTEPVVDYDRRFGRNSVTGGHAYRGSAIPSLVGWYVYADFTTGHTYGIRYDRDTGTILEHADFTAALNPKREVGLISSFGEDADGELLLCGWSTGTIWKLVPR